MKGKRSLTTVVCLMLIVLFPSTASLPQSGSVSDLDALERSAKQLRLRWNRKSIKESSSIYKRVSIKWRERGRVTDAARCLREASRLLLILGNQKESEQFLNQALHLSASNEEKAKILSDLSLIANYQGKMNASQNYSDQAVRFAETSQSDSAKGMAFHSQGYFHYFRNNIEESNAAFDKSLASWKRTDDREGEAETLLSMGYLFVLQSKFTKAQDHFNKALRLSHKNGNRRGEAFTLKAIGSAFKKMNQPQDALVAFRKAALLFPEDIDLGEKAGLQNWIGSVYEEYGNWDRSTSFRKEALRLFQNENHIYGQLATLSSLSNLSHYSGRNDEALDFLNQAKKLAETINDRFYLATLDARAADIYKSKNQLEKALGYYQSSKKLFQKNVYQKQLSMVENSIGSIYEQQNDLPEARKYYETALRLTERVRYKFGKAAVLNNLARLDTKKEDDEAALKKLEKSIEITEDLSTTVLNSRITSTYFSNVFDRYEEYIHLLMKMHKRFPNRGFDLQALQASEKSRSRSMLENMRLADAKFLKDADPKSVRRENEIRAAINSKSERLTVRLSAEAPHGEIKLIEDEIGVLDDELADIKSELKQKSPVYSAVKNPPDFSLESFQRESMDDDSLVLEFSIGTKASYLWLIGKGEFDSFVLPNKETIEKSIDKIGDLLVSRNQQPGETVSDYRIRINLAEESYWKESQELSDMLFGRLRGRLSNKRLIIVPDGRLGYFPVSALPLPNQDPSSDKRNPILLTNQVVYEPSASILHVLNEFRDRDVNPNRDLLVFSDPIFSADDPRLESRMQEANPAESPGKTRTRSIGLRSVSSLEDLRRLPASKEESESIINFFDSRRSKLLTGFSSNRDLFLNSQLHDYKILHFATHGLLNEDRPELSGIVLSQYEESGKSRESMIRLHDIYGLNLSADLVVLSSCESGIGKEIKGEGLRSLTNAFLQVGARAVVSSRWKVDDYATLELMEDFYRGMAKDQLTPSEALRRSKIKMFNESAYKSPFYWAAFTIQGDYLNRPRIKPGFDYKNYSLVLICSLIIFGIFYCYTHFRSK